jgi:hypothetical protein
VHPGNRHFRDLINANRRSNLKSRKNDKPAISCSIVRAIREMNGRFLKKDEKLGLYGIHELQEKQKNDPGRYLVNRYASKIRQYFCSTSKVVHSDVGQQGDNSGEKEKLKTK